MKNVIVVVSLSLFAASGLAAGDSSMAEPELHITPEFVDHVLIEGVGRNPGLAAASARHEAANAAVDAVRSWEDPTVTLSLSLPTTRGMKSSEEGNLIYGVEQKLPVFDRPKLAREAAVADATKEMLSLSVQTAKLRRDLTLTLVDLALADRTLELTKEDLGWLDATVTAVDHRYQVGKATQVEWLKIQTERAKTADRIITLKLEREHEQVELNRLLNRDLHAPWPVVA